ncbi:hypothetical protein CANCADRAFT_104292 [Tortispora caseinolytica NRRL Y-17796]|uniref:Succinyl-CoA:3-ketoacid-coenzyme A transferase n=1 Tax=Tortispora caseinolytica NRRL Y-17796 TaxID=767744 RepID=A0A1E4TET3_9ASCO|nr:hypothetical protein CANCADRAFT_104292 [Tortispora caseinolytica NRRL Y-17796]
MIITARARFCAKLSLPSTFRSFSVSSSCSTVNKVYDTIDAAIDDVKSGSFIGIGGFGLCGVPFSLINKLGERADTVKDLVVSSNNAGVDGVGIGRLVNNEQVKRVIASYVGENAGIENRFMNGQLELELVPQGTLAEKFRAGGAGIPAFYTPAGYGTWVQEGGMPIRMSKDGKTIVQKSEPKEVREFNGKKYVMEPSLVPDFAFIHAEKADTLGNCVFRYTAGNYNAPIAKSGKITIVEAEEIVEAGSLKPEEIHVPGIYVDRVVKSTEPKRCERITTREPGADPAASIKHSVNRMNIVRRAAQEFQNGMYANLGIGLPMLAPTFLSSDVSVILQSENGILGLGPYPLKGEEDPDLINAGKETVSIAQGGAVFSSDESFGMIRAGRINMTILGGMQVSQYGDLANWMVPGKLKGMGGAMDLVAHPDMTRVVVTMEHCDRKGNPKIVESCEFPLTGVKCVSRIITDLAVFDVDRETGLTLREYAPGSSVEEVTAKTGAKFKVADDVKPMSL